MRIAVYVPLLCALLFAAAGPRLAVRHLTPRAGLWTLTLGAGVASAASTWSLVLLAGTLLDEIDPSTRHRFPDPVNDLVATLAVGLLLAGLVRLGYVVGARIRLHRRWRRSCAPDSGPVVVLADPVPDAFALPGAGGRIVVSRGMLTALTPDERRVLFAHERAHLRQRHHRHSAAVQAAAALNPLLIPVRGISFHLCERCADETAAAEVGDRELAASALARAALAAVAVPEPAGGTRSGQRWLRYHHTGVAARVLALQHVPARGRLGLAALLAVAALAPAVLAVAADVDATGDFLSLVLHTAHIGW